MTFRGATYETIIDIERLIIVSECRLDIYNLELKKAVKQCNKVELEEVKIKINIEEKFLEEIKERRDFLLEEIEKLNHDLNDTEFKIFISKFIKGKSSGEIESELHLSHSRYHEICQNISRVMENTPYGSDIIECLKID